MSLQQSALRLPEGGDEWQVDPAIVQAQTALDQQQPQDDPNAEAIEQAPQNLQTNEPPALSDLEQVALGLGWTPKDQWRGDPNKHVGAKDYLATTGRVLERTKNDLKLTRRQTDELNARLARLEQGDQTQRAQRAQELFEQYEDAKFEAAQKGDTELYRKLTKEQQETVAKVRPEPAPQRQSVDETQVYQQAEAIMQDPVAVRFFEANPIALHDEAAWALMDREMTRAATNGAGAAAQFKAAEEALRYAYPDTYQRSGFNGQIPNNQQTQQQHHSQQQPRAEDGKFVPPVQQQQRRPAPPMAGATHVARPPAGDASAVDRLPADARAFMDTQVKAGKVKDPDVWAKAYLGEKLTFSGARK